MYEPFDLDETTPSYNESSLGMIKIININKMKNFAFSALEVSKQIQASKEEEDLNAHECHRCKYCDEPFPNKARLLKHTRAHLNVNTGDYESKILRQEPLNIWTSV